MLDELIKAYGDKFLVAALGVSLALLCLFIVLWLLRNRAPSPFVRGGRNRQPRLQVLDAAAVDTRRRIVLVRRDNVEHLVMIGGPTDIVIESGIGDERPYLSARPIQPQDLAEQQDLAETTVRPALAATEPASPAIASAAVASHAIMASAPAEAPPRRPMAAETLRPAAVSPQVDPQPMHAPIAEPRRPQAAPMRGPEPAIETVVTAAPVAAVATAAAAPVAAAAMTARPEVAPQVRVQAPAVEPLARPEPPVEPSPVQPTASLEPMMVASAPTATAPVDIEPVMRRNEPMIGVDESPMEAKTSGTPPIEAFRIEPVQPIMRNELDARKIEEVRVEPQVATPSVIDAPAAEDLLEAARQRVLVPVQATASARLVEPQRIDPQVESQPSAGPSEPEARDMSDFERVLEEEMALHLATDPAPAPQLAPQTPQILPETRADRPRPPIAAILPETNRATPASPNAAQPAPEPNLQNEIARIFGEMSASRNP
ncbi:MAG: flagellar biosynthetic protein FliO [Agrobacterium albertimagni]